MSSDPVRLVNDPNLSDSERKLLVIGARQQPIRYDTDAGLARFRASIQALAASQNAPTAGSNGAGGLKVAMHKILVKIGLTLAVPVAVVATIRISNMSSGGDNGQSSRLQGDDSTSSISHAGVGAVNSHKARALSPSGSISETGRDKADVAVAITASSRRKTTRFRPTATRPSNTSTRLSSRPRSTRNPTAAVSTEGSRATSVGSNVRVPEEISISEDLPNQQAEAPSAAATREQPLENPSAEPEPRAAGSFHPPDQASSVVPEMQEIARARKLVTTDPEEALELLETTAGKYPRGYFVEERRALTIFALVASGNQTRAKELSLTFLRDYPIGFFADNVRRAVTRKPNSANKEKAGTGR